MPVVIPRIIITGVIHGRIASFTAFNVYLADDFSLVGWLYFLELKKYT